MLNNSPIDQVFHALAEPTRRAIVERLSAGPTSVSELAKPFEMTLAAIVQHLQILERSGLIQTEKTGRVRTCRMNRGGLALAEQWIQDRRLLWERRLDLLGEVISETRQKRSTREKKP